MKKTKKWLILLLICILIFSISTVTIANLGDFRANILDKANYSDINSRNNSKLNYSNKDSGTSIVVIVLFVVAILSVIKIEVSIATSGAKSKAFKRRTNNGYIPDSNLSIVVANEAIKVDPDFTREKFISNVKDLFIRFQNAWMERDISDLRSSMSDTIFEQYSKLIQNYIDKKQINKLERITTNFIEFVSFNQDDKNYVLVVVLNSSMIDYIIDENTGKVLKGNTEKRITNTYRITFIRSKDDVIDELKTTKCFSCGASTHITSSGRCEYCNSVVAADRREWILNEIERII